MKTHSHAGLLTDSILAEEIELETLAVTEGVARYRHLADQAVVRGQGSSLKPTERLLLHWYEPLLEEIRQIQRRWRSGEAEIGGTRWGEVLDKVSSEELAVITLHETMNECLTDEFGVRYSAVAYRIGAAVLAEQNWELLKKHDRKIAQHIYDKVKRVDARHINLWAKKTITDTQVWRRILAAHVGARLLWALVETASVHDEGEPYRLAFHIRNQRRGRKLHKLLQLDEKALDIIENGHRARQGMRPRYLPMIVPPYPWSEKAQGGYVKIRTPFVAKPTREQKTALDKTDLSGVYRRLTALTAPGWRINRRVYDAVLKVRAMGGGVVSIPPGRRIDKPARPANFDTNEAAKKAWKKAAVLVHRQNIRIAADTVSFEHKLAVAERMLDRPAIYFPHQLDFRGRCCPVPPHLNHHGDDVCRGLLESADSVPLGPRGEFWLKVQAANTFGIDKVSFEERAAWTDANASNINRVASDPIGTMDWWSKAEEPWQFVAACFALDDDGTRHLTDADGTANGLQHYAALGRDSAGAAVVNLIDSDRPAGIYNMVADQIRPKIEADSSPEAASILRVIDAGLVKWRALVKQPTMTKVYGVTLIGARDQQRALLRDAGLSGDELKNASFYLSRLTLAAVAEVCVAADQIMTWIQQCGRQIVDAGHSIRWTSPSGFPVVQPYRRFKAVTVTTLAGELQQLVDEGDVPIKKGKQLNGVAPNYIHSIDKAHMLDTALACQEAGVWFAAVHDCFKTHAGSRDEMNVAVREQFVALHSRALLDELLAEWRRVYPDVNFPEPPARGDFDIRQVLNARYAFS